MSEKIDPDTLLRAYSMGLFPMADLDESGSEQLGWYSPEHRGVIPLEKFHIPRGLKRALKKDEYEIRMDTVFPEVIDKCGEREETWISPGLKESYTQLFDLGWAHSVESWYQGELMGGLYGVSIAGAFFGESMFSRRSDASKVALVHLVAKLRQKGFSLLDTQWSNPHLVQFGCIEIPREQYLEELEAALALETSF